MTTVRTEPPAERDVSAPRHAQLRAAAMRQITVPRRSAWAVPAVAAAVTALLIAGVAAVPILRHHGTAPAAAGGQGPHVLVAAYTDDKGRRVWDPRSHTYVTLAGSEQRPLPAPDGRWTAVGVDTFNALRIAPPSQIEDPGVGQVDKRTFLRYGSFSGGMVWSADSSRLYVKTSGTGYGPSEPRVLGIDPARHAVVSVTDLHLPNDIWVVVSADPRTGFIVLRAGILITFSPSGTRISERRVNPTGDPLWVAPAGILAPDGRRLAINHIDLDRRKLRVGSVDLRTGRKVDVPSPDGHAAGWADADHYVLYKQLIHAAQVFLIEADTGRTVRTGSLTDATGKSLSGAQFVPLTGPPPPGAITF